MTTAFQISIPSTFSDLGRTRAATASLEMLNAMSKPSTAEKYFGGVVPIWQYNRGSSRWTDRVATYWPSLESTSLREWHNLDLAFAHGRQMMDWPRIIDDKSVVPHTFLTIPHHARTVQREPTEYASDLVTAQKSASKLDVISQRYDPGAKPFVLLERARRLLSKQRIRDARDLLHHGAASYPEDNNIAALLRAVSPGRVRRNRGSTQSRRQEMDWIQKHGHKYRGQWVAISGDHLVASASTLDKLLVDVKRLRDARNTPVIQQIAPE